MNTTILVKSGTSTMNDRSMNKSDYVFVRVPFKPRALRRCFTITTNVHEMSAISKNGLVRCESKCVNVDVNVSISSVKF
jgi:hypothetical protein